MPALYFSFSSANFTLPASLVSTLPAVKSVLINEMSSGDKSYACILSFFSSAVAFAPKPATNEPNKLTEPPFGTMLPLIPLEPTYFSSFKPVSISVYLL